MSPEMLVFLGGGVLSLGLTAFNVWVHKRHRPMLPEGWVALDPEEWDRVGWLVESTRKGDSLGRRIHEDRLDLERQIAELKRENGDLRWYRAVWRDAEWSKI